MYLLFDHRFAWLIDVGYIISRILKTGGVEVAREKWDEEDLDRNPDDTMDIEELTKAPAPRSVLPDWTRAPLPVGAPAANVRNIVQPSPSA